MDCFCGLNLHPCHFLAVMVSSNFLLPSLIFQIKNAIISHGCFLRECSIEHSIVGERSRLDSGVELKGVEESDRGGEGFYIRSGITVILEKATISDGIVI
ncbi:Trimeric LpxA-like protein [Cynara cardunculus var. scolymus]|uniref:Trimeric LpxA-like protein n=1 Tax=Cynara cardunculus var. scolymus TaxID=59895 RepID=A0A103Y3W1_CYNCS|nr:Trimeric LpxA-like protein [Cynara cardunculus var. scolymus]